MLRRLPTALTLVACVLLALAGGALASTHSSTRGRGIRYLHPEAVRLHKASGARPSISSVSPMHVKVGDKVVIYGKNFRSGAGADKVFFIKPGGGIVYTKVQTATATRLVVAVPKGVNKLLLDSTGTTLVATKLQLRVLSTRFGAPTKLSSSPTISPTSSKPSTGGGGPACLKPTATDSDGDGLTNAFEINSLKTDPCKADTDGDGVPDGYEYQSALDLNNTTLTGPSNVAQIACPCTTPWPDPINPTDAKVDHDGDGLTMLLEYQLNKFVGGPKVGDLQYSDGKQRSQIVAAPSDPTLAYMDLVRYPQTLQKGFLSDDERDADGDGLSNWDECCGRMTQNWWDSKFTGSVPGFPKESHYQTTCGDGTSMCPVTYPGVDPMKRDTDGDGIPDGLDDQDHDGLSNAFEVSRPWDWQATYVSVGPETAHDGPKPYNFKSYGPTGGDLPDGVGPNPWARVQPFNPCKPVYSKTCAIMSPSGPYPGITGYYQGEDWMGADPETIGPQPTAPWLFDTVNDTTYPAVQPVNVVTGPANGENYAMQLGTP